MVMWDQHVHHSHQHVHHSHPKPKHMHVCPRIVPSVVTTEVPEEEVLSEISPVEWDMRGAIEELSLKLDVLLEKVSVTLGPGGAPYLQRSMTLKQPGPPGISELIRRSRERSRK